MLLWKIGRIEKGAKKEKSLTFTVPQALPRSDITNGLPTRTHEQSRQTEPVHLGSLSRFPVGRTCFYVFKNCPWGASDLLMSPG